MCVCVCVCVKPVVRQGGLMVRVSTFHAVGCGFEPLPGHTKENCCPAWHACVRVGV